MVECVQAELEDMTMQISLPKPVRMDDVKTGSLVRAPDDNGNRSQWAIGTSEGKLFLLDTRDQWRREGPLADFGTDYRVTVDPTRCRKLYPWDGKDPAPGSLCIFSEDKKVCHSILFSALKSQILRVFVFEKGKAKKGEMQTINQDKEYGVVFPNWRIGLKDADEPSGYKCVYKFSEKAKK